MNHDPIAVIGIGQDGPESLSSEAKDHIRRARTLAGGKRHLAFFPDFAGETIVIDADLDRMMIRLKESQRGQKTVVLASGDPLLYGIGRRLLAEFPKDVLIFFPQISCIQLAFARVKETWHDARVVSVHGRPLETLLSALAGRATKIAVLTDNVNNPSAIARYLNDLGCAGEYTIWVCEELGGPRERVRRWTPDTDVSSLNVVVLLRNRAQAGPETPLLGIPEDELQHRQTLITKPGPRLLALTYLQLRPRDVLWDVGAGSGSVGIEAARLSAELRVFAVERDQQALQDIRANVRHFGAYNVQVIAGEAPEALAGLPDPDCVFIGGSGGRLGAILQSVAARLKPGGRLVLNCIALETFTQAWANLRDRGWNPEATSIQLAHSRALGNLHCLDPDKPLFILQATKPSTPAGLSERPLPACPAGEAV